MITFEKKYWEVEASMMKIPEDICYDLPPMPDWIRTQVIWPFRGAYARVIFSERDNPNNRVSTYLDVGDNLGVMGAPYFEAYPMEDEDTARYSIDEQGKMYHDIVNVLDERRKK